jgi:DNA invertase Pin-like site-specific DNA recombinase
LKHRKGLQQLLQDVVGGTATYQTVLVYDVSRWGRFQDSDESAHYEFLCKSAGVSADVVGFLKRGQRNGIENRSIRTDMDSVRQCDFSSSLLASARYH